MLNTLVHSSDVGLDLPVGTYTAGAPIDIAAHGARLAVVESNGGGVAHLTQFSIDQDGHLTQTASSAVVLLVAMFTAHLPSAFAGRHFCKAGEGLSERKDT